MKQHIVLFILLVVAMLSLLTINGCKKETENLPPIEFYEFDVRTGDKSVYLKYWFACARNENYGIEVSYYLNGEKKVQKAFGEYRMTISGLNNNESYEFTIIRYDKDGNKDGIETFRAIPNNPFVVVSPTSSDDYSIENGKVRINIRFNRPADTTSLDDPVNDFIHLFVGLSYQPSVYDNRGLSYVSHSYKWLENGMVLSILTDKTRESFCTGSPCYLYLLFKFSYIGAQLYSGLSDTNGMQLDGNNDGYEMGDGKLTFILK